MEYEHFKIFELINNFIKFSDVKAGVIITFDMALVGAVLGKFEKFQILNQLSCSRSIFILSTLTFFIFILMSLAKALYSVHPSLKAKGHISNIFFGHIAGKNLETYKQEVSASNNSYSYENDLLCQIKINSDICWKKYQHISWAIKFTAISILSLTISIIIIIAA